MVRVKVTKTCGGYYYGYGIYEGRRGLMHQSCDYWATEKAATRNAKAMAKKIGIKYDPEIIKQHGC